MYNLLLKLFGKKKTKQRNKVVESSHKKDNWTNEPEEPWQSYDEEMEDPWKSLENSSEETVAWPSESDDYICMLEDLRTEEPQRECRLMAPRKKEEPHIVCMLTSGRMFKDLEGKQEMTSEEYDEMMKGQTYSLRRNK